ncbi:MAG: ROK family protein [Novipirellula sp. JB048]
MTSSAKNIWIGFDLGGTKMLAIAYDEKWRPLGRKRRKTRGRAGADHGLQRVATTIERLLAENEIAPSRVAGIGIGCPGPIDLTHGRILTTPNLGWDDVDVAGFLKQRFGCAVTVLNDVDAGVYGEYQFGAAQRARCVVGIFPGTGVGGGCVHEGKILRGAHFSCMEIGHTRISSDTRVSGSAIPGTLEAEASRLTVAAEAAKAAFRGNAPSLMKQVGTDLSDIRSGALADAIDKGDQVIERIVEEAARSIGIAVANVIHILAPDKIILGGGLVEAMEDLIVKTVRQAARENVMSVYEESFEVVAATLGDDAGAMGAAAWAKRQATS